jgi:hypothetical protein
MRKLLLALLILASVVALQPGPSVRAASGDRKIKILSMTIDLVDPLHTYCTVSYKYRVQDRVATDQEITSGVLTIDLGAYNSGALAKNLQIKDIRALIVTALDTNATVPVHDVTE